jgi:hypothetical protein
LFSLVYLRVAPSFALASNAFVLILSHTCFLPDDLVATPAKGAWVVATDSQFVPPS